VSFNAKRSFVKGSAPLSTGPTFRTSRVCQRTIQFCFLHAAGRKDVPDPISSNQGSLEMKKTKSSPKAAAVTHLFEGETADACSEIRKTVDGVLRQASDGGISSATDNDALLTLYIIPDKVQFLYIALNQAFAHRTGFTPFGSSEIKKSSTVGAVRDGAYKHCGVKCSHT